MRAAFAATLAVALLAHVAPAQIAPGVTLAPGAHVRVSSGGERERGEVLSHDADSLRIRRGGSVRGWRFSEVQRLEVRGGRDRRRGMTWGAGILGGVGLVFGGIDAANGTISGGDYVATVVTNALIGGAIGMLVSPRGWRDVPLVRQP